MANETHFYLTADGDYNPSTAPLLAQETWQIGIRLAAVFGGEVDPLGTLPDNVEVTRNTINRTETSWTIQGNWEAGKGTIIFRPDDYLNDLAGPAFATWIATSNTFSSRARLRSLRLYPIGADGKSIPAPPYAQGSPMLLTYTGTLPSGGNSGAPLPPQNTPVASHRTAQVGRRGRGRAYLPVLPVGAVGEGVISNSVRDALSAAQATLLAALAYDRTLPDILHVRPIVTGAPWVNYAVINQVRVGNVMDTQRRRRKSIDETFKDTAVNY